MAPRRDWNTPLLALIILMFFCWGFATVLLDTLVPKLKATFSLSYAEVLLTQFSFFLGYLVFSLPSSRLVARLGYMNSLVAGLGVMVLGCLLFVPAVALGRFSGFLAALFVMAAGITLLQVAANPLITRLGNPQRAHSRLSLAQAFNSLGTTVGPLVGTALILRPEGLSGITRPFLLLAVVLSGLALAFWHMRRLSSVPPTGPVASGSARQLMARPRFALGMLSIFVYVGAEVSLGSLMISYLMQPSVLSLKAPEAGPLVSFYWGGAMVGRFLGSAALTVFPARRVLLACAVTALSLVVASSRSTGLDAAVLLLAVGLFNSIMFPVIFSLTLEGLGEEAPEGSGLLCLAIVGGAIIPPLTGFAADHSTLAEALWIPATCYAVIGGFALLERRLQSVDLLYAAKQPKETTQKNQ